MTIREILKAEPQSKRIFQKYGLNYQHCLFMEFEDACGRYSANSEVIKKELICMHTSGKRLAEPLNQVIETILNNHATIKETISRIQKALQNAIQHEPAYRYELLTIKTKFEILSENLEIHLYKEEMVLYPEFINLWSKKIHRTAYKLSFNLMYPIERLLSEHETAKDTLNEIKELSHYYKIPQNVGEHYRLVCAELKIFEDNLANLIHVEDTILFPEALTLEKDFSINAPDN